MSDKIDFQILLHDSRARVYLLWAALTSIGFTSTHYWQKPSINALWFAVAVIGLGYMYKVMPLRVVQMKRIFLAWLVPITFGLISSAASVHTDLFPELGGYLGAFWLMVMAIGYAWNGLADPPSSWYYIAAVVNVVAAAFCYFVADFNSIQYLIAAVVSVWSMLNLWIFRSDVA